MKKIGLLITTIILGILSIQAAPVEDKISTYLAYGYGRSFIFNEGNVTFSVYPDGEFDFYIANQIHSRVHVDPVGITFNSGYDYNPYVQYDDYGAVVQIEHIPVYYDYYGRVSRIGGVNVRYGNGRIQSIGGLYVHYRAGVFSHCTGFINPYNRYYVYRPFHRYFARPTLRFCNVYYRPYRRYYTPIRYRYHRPYAYNPRRVHVKIGKTYAKSNRYRNAVRYQNDSRVTTRNNTSVGRSTLGRSNRATVQNSQKTIVSQPNRRIPRQASSQPVATQNNTNRSAKIRRYHNPLPKRDIAQNSSATTKRNLKNKRYNINRLY